MGRGRLHLGQELRGGQSGEDVVRQAGAEDVASKRGAVRTDGDDLNDLVSYEDGSDGDTVGERLGHSDDVGLDLERVLGVSPHRPASE